VYGTGLTQGNPALHGPFVGLRSTGSNLSTESGTGCLARPAVSDFVNPSKGIRGRIFWGSEGEAPCKVRVPGVQLSALNLN